MNIGRRIGILAAMATISVRSIRGQHPRGRSTGTLEQIVADQKRIWMAPVAVIRGDGWRPALGVVGATGILIAFDPTLAPLLQRPAFQEARPVAEFNRVLSGRHTALALNAFTWLFQIAGRLGAGPYLTETGLLAGEAAANAEIVAMAMKHLDLRMRPSEVGPNGDFSRTWLRTKNRSWDGSGCFPSGHTAAAFAIATVFAERYRGNKWISAMAFGLAGLLGVSRLTTRAHFPSDVLFGAALGCSVSHYVVLRR
jgi:membrane-associated phospholipid phosphatase